MAGAQLSSKSHVSSSSPIMNKAMSAVSTIGHGLAIAHGIREAAPVVMGAVRTAGSLLPLLGVI